MTYHPDHPPASHGLRPLHGGNGHTNGHAKANGNGNGHKNGHSNGNGNGHGHTSASLLEAERPVAGVLAHPHGESCQCGEHHDTDGASAEEDEMSQYMDPKERIDPKRVASLEQFSTRELMYQILKNLGEDPERQGLQRTPYRIEKALSFLTSGHQQNVKDFLNKAVFDSDTDEMVLVKDIRFYSMCEHHMLPFYGTAHVAYLPAGKVVGLSKIPRIVDMFSRRLQIQEQLCHQIAQCIDQVLQPRGVAVIMTGLHFCMMMRGVQKEQARTTTSAMLGEFRSSPQTRSELMHLLKVD